MLFDFVFLLSMRIAGVPFAIFVLLIALVPFSLGAPFLKPLTSLSTLFQLLSEF